MARSPIAFGSVVCSACGAKVREDRLRCLRCGELLAAKPESQSPRSAVLTKVLAVSAGLGAVALAGLVGTRPAPAASAPQIATARVTKRSATPNHPAVVTSLDARRPGEAAYNAGNLPAARVQFERAVEADPNDPEALNNLGQVLVRMGRTADAIALFDRAIAIVPQKWSYRFNRARAFAVLERWTDAVAGYRDALAIFPGDYATCFNLAKALQKSGDLEAAIETYERAIQLAPGEADFHLAYGLALEAVRRPKDAAAAYRRYLELDERSAEADKVRARIAALERVSAANP